MRFSLVLAGLLATASPGLAQSIGLLIGNEDYANLRDLRRGDRIVTAARDLERAGVEITSRADATLDDTLWALSDFAQKSAAADRVIIALSGRFLHSATETYFLPVEGEPGPLATLAARALPLSTVTALLAAHPGGALLSLATDDQSAPHGPHLTEGLGPFDIPQGVTVLIGPPRDMTDFLRDRLPRPGRPYAGAARQAGLEVQGYAPDTHVLLTERTSRPPATANDRRADILAWRNASEANTAEAYQSYLDAHPGGEFARMAENRMRALRDTPEALAERAEQALDLNRDARRAIQRDLSLLGFNTRGIDGIFGRGTRAAITAWQRRDGAEATGFLTSDQIADLAAAARIRARELEAEAERRRQEQMRADLDFWTETGAGRDEAGLRRYLDRYPDGEFSETARARLGQIEDDKRREASRHDRALWDEVTRIDTAQAYEAYLNRAPDGAFREEARARLLALDTARDNARRNDAAARAERQLNLSPRTREIIEARLNGMGHKPGAVDGRFDDDTRRAIRRYQATRNMEETGYLSEAVVVQLLADTVRQIFR
ncbi:MAG: peptidoglycan-binding protein [Silicimonas sp.]|nr:peptidoglycan-binding protein [Silicimonas sp.]